MRARARGSRGGGGSGQAGEQISRLVGDTVGRRGDASGVWHARDGAERLSWLTVGDRLAVGGVHTDEVLVLGVAHLEDVVLRLVGANVFNANTIETVVAVVGCVGVLGIANLEARDVITDEARRRSCQQKLYAG